MDNKNVSSIINVISLYVLITYIFFITPLMQIEMHLFKKVIIKGMHFQILLMIMLILYIIIYIAENNKVKINLNKLSILSIIFIIYIVFDAIINFIVNKYSFVYVAYVLNEMFFILYGLVLLLFPTRINKKSLKKLFIYLIVLVSVNIAFALIQHIFNNTFYMYNTDQQGNQLFQYGTFNLSGRIRAIGTQSSGLKLGIILSFVLSILFVRIIYNNNNNIINKKYLVIISLVVLYTIYNTYTRNLFFIVIYMCIYILLYKCIKKNNRNIFMKIYPLIIPLLYTMGVFLLTSKLLINMKNTFLLSAQSYLTRLIFWREFFGGISNWNIFSILCGKFIVQIEKSKAYIYNVKELTLDNMYLNYIGMIGILGTLILLIIIWYLYIRIAEESENDITLLAMCAFLSAIYTYGIYNVLENVYIVLAIIAPIIYINSSNKCEHQIKTKSQ